MMRSIYVAARTAGCTPELYLFDDKDDRDNFVKFMKVGNTQLTVYTGVMWNTQGHQVQWDKPKLP